ncbi:uncharacterized protein HMPREF1541_07978 [Cyphellophora europaea CBS 101466]|uniref:Uncharacterized protein n=1 Tax=Cyphellophora europaea (strain CBS 101466) TaxID=1220924 RepID=W2RKZ0_CYPE1|nr:uncharacterized protein HMPREF1541_07978 [Cyphellophora europaea CBS 101466]ETN36990.1 hypothetical protein HMPREF1541_07978 [Cyphellophora europaea CBS 101466]
MSTNPAHVAHARGGSARLIPPQELIRIRKLYLEKRYKNCIAACDELVQTPPSTPVTPSFFTNTPLELHPVHRMFLVFHQAISYESMGLAAHKYSQNKLRFFESAKERFDVALEVLPQPFAGGENGSYGDDQAGSPISQIDPNDESGYGSNSSKPNSPLDASDVSEDEATSPFPDRSMDEAGVTKHEETLSLTGLGGDTSSDIPRMQVSQRTRAVSIESLASDASGPSFSRMFAIPDFSKYSPRRDRVEQDSDLSDTGSETPKANRSANMLPRSTPVVQVVYADSDSSDDEDTDNQKQMGWLPRSSRSLNLAAHEVNSSDEESDDAVGTPSKAPTPLALATPVIAAIDSLSKPAAGKAQVFRLSASLSSNHMLCEDLMPPPLFSKYKKVAKIQSDDPAATSRSPRPLPRMPFSSHSQLNLLPARKTAVQTLISKYEGTIPGPDTPSSYTTATPPPSTLTQTTLHTPITPRFKMIHHAFDTAVAEDHLAAYLTSRSLANYNAQLAAFRTCLLTVSEHVGELLVAAETLQRQHEEEKRLAALRDAPDGLPTNRLASMWLLSTPGKPTGANGWHGGAGRRLQDSTTLSASRSQLLARSESLRGRKKLPLRNRVEESEERRAERIKKLRDHGFHVRKERYGWKGGDYYEAFRRKAEIELVA